MADRSAPIANRGPEALQMLLVGDRTGAEQQLRHLTRTELRQVADTAETLAEVARRIIRDAWPNSG